MEFIYGVAATFIVFLIIGAYLNIMKKLNDIGRAVGYIAKREMDFEEAEKQINRDLEKAQDNLNRVYTN
jgi:hypothetical protein